MPKEILEKYAFGLEKGAVAFLCGHLTIIQKAVLIYGLTFTTIKDASSSACALLNRRSVKCGIMNIYRIEI